MRKVTSISGYGSHILWMVAGIKLNRDPVTLDHTNVTWNFVYLEGIHDSYLTSYFSVFFL